MTSARIRTEVTTISCRGSVRRRSQSHTLLAGASLTSTLQFDSGEPGQVWLQQESIFHSIAADSRRINIGAADQYGRPRDFSLPDVAGFGCLSLFDSNGQWRKTGTWSAGDNLSWVKGAHTIKIGGDLRWVYEDGFNSFTSRSLVTLRHSEILGTPRSW